MHQSFPQKSIKRYLREIRDYPSLTNREREALVRALPSEQARQALIAGLLHEVVTLARQYARLGRTSLADLIGEGNVCLVQAVQEYDPTIPFDCYLHQRLEETMQQAVEHVCAHPSTTKTARFEQHEQYTRSPLDGLCRQEALVEVAHGLQAIPVEIREVMASVYGFVSGPSSVDEIAQVLGQPRAQVLASLKHGLALMQRVRAPLWYLLLSSDND